MKIAAAKGVAGLKMSMNLMKNIYSVFNKGVGEAVAYAVTSVARKLGTGRA